MSEIDTSRGSAEPGQPPERPDRGVGPATVGARPVVDLAARRRMAAAPATGPAGSGDGGDAQTEAEDPTHDEGAAPVHAERSEGPGAVVRPLNDAAAIYDALADEIRGSAIGWSDSALAQLERGLLERYGPLIGGRHPVRRLVRLAARPPAA